jgi:hypothetical protein
MHFFYNVNYHRASIRIGDHPRTRKDFTCRVYLPPPAKLPNRPVIFDLIFPKPISLNCYDFIPSV